MNWQIDQSHSNVYFTARHMMISKVRGRFETFSGTVNFDEANPENTTVDIEITANSISTRDDQRDGHLRSPDFLNVAEYPTLSFKSTRVEKTGENEGKLYGDLTIRNVTKPVVLNVEFAGIAKSPWGVESAGFSASTKINREEWNLTWNQALETGGVLVGKDINIEIELELAKVPQEQGEAAA